MRPGLATLRRTAGRRLRRLRRPRVLVGWSARPLSVYYGYDRGTPVDRVYIDAFLRAQGADIRGRVLDIGDDDHTRRFGTGVTQSDVLGPSEELAGVTVVGDLETGEGFPAGAFDCVLLLETLNLIYDTRRAIQAVFDSLAPGGVVLCTVNGIAGIEPDWPDFWRFTDRSLARLFAERFGESNVTVSVRGNVRTAAAYLYGAAAEELPRRAYETDDPRYQVLICLRAVRPG